MINVRCVLYTHHNNKRYTSINSDVLDESGFFFILTIESSSNSDNQNQNLYCRKTCTICIIDVVKTLILLQSNLNNNCLILATKSYINM